MTETSEITAQKNVHDVKIKIDRAHYNVEQTSLTGEQLRQLPVPPIGADRDLFEVIPGSSDRKVEASDVVQLKNGKRFFTAPSHINPGQAAAWVQ